MKVTKATRWRVFAGVWLQSLFTSATAFFSLFCIPLTTQFGWSDSDFALAYTIYMFVYCAVGFIGGSLAEKLSPRITIYIGLCLFAGGWILTGFATTIPQLYLFYGLLAGAGGGMIYPACLPTALKWFPDRSGSISGLVQAGACLRPLHYEPHRSGHDQQPGRSDDLPCAWHCVPDRRGRRGLDDRPLPRGLGA